MIDPRIELVAPFLIADRLAEARAARLAAACAGEPRGLRAALAVRLARLALALDREATLGTAARLNSGQPADWATS